MIRIFTLILLAMLTAGLSADENKFELRKIGEDIRAGKIDVGDKYSVDAKTGRYHAIHVDVIGMECSSCHFGERYHPDYLLVGKDKPYPRRAQGQLDRSSCLGCHREGAEGTTFYGASATGKTK